MEPNNIDKLFRDAFLDKEESPRPAVWDKIEQQLNEETNVVPLYRKYLPAIAIAATIVLLSSLAIMLFQQRPQEKEVNSHIIALAPDTADDLSEKTSTPQDAMETPQQPLSIEKTEAQSYLSFEKTSHPYETEKEHETRASHIMSEELIAAAEHKVELESLEEIEMKTISIEPEPADIDVSPIAISDNHESELQYAVNYRETKRTSVITRFLNKVAQNIEIQKGKNLFFSNDEEGSLSINLSPAYVSK